MMKPAYDEVVVLVLRNAQHIGLGKEGRNADNRSAFNLNFQAVLDFESSGEEPEPRFGRPRTSE